MIKLNNSIEMIMKAYLKFICLMCLLIVMIVFSICVFTIFFLVFLLNYHNSLPTFFWYISKRLTDETRYRLILMIL